MSEPGGLSRGLTSYGDPDFARYLSRSFARSTGVSPRCSTGRWSASR